MCLMPRQTPTHIILRIKPLVAPNYPGNMHFGLMNVPTIRLSIIRAAVLVLLDGMVIGNSRRSTRQLANSSLEIIIVRLGY